MNTVSSFVNDTARALIQKRNEVLGEQLNLLIRQGILIIEETQPVLVQEPTPHGVVVKVQMSVDLKVRDQERLQELVRENEELKDRIVELTEILHNPRG